MLHTKTCIIAGVSDKLGMLLCYTILLVIQPYDYKC